MTVMIQVSPKDTLGTLYNIKSEAEEPDVTWADFGAILVNIGGAELAATVRGTLADVLSAGRVPPPVSTVADPLAAAVATVRNTFPNAEPVTPQYPSAGAPVCQHGEQKIVYGNSKKDGKPWKAWGCPAKQGDPTGCGLTFIRD